MCPVGPASPGPGVRSFRLRSGADEAGGSGVGARSTSLLETARRHLQLPWSGYLPRRVRRAGLAIHNGLSSGGVTGKGRFHATRCSVCPTHFRHPAVKEPIGRGALASGGGAAVGRTRTSTGRRRTFHVGLQYLDEFGSNPGSGTRARGA